jgi:hypothetical protein
MSNGAGARVDLPEGAGREAARSVSVFLDALSEIDPFTRRPDGAARRVIVIDEQRDRVASRLADEQGALVRSEPDVSERAKGAQTVIDAIDDRLRRERETRDLALWVMLFEHEAAVSATGVYTGTGWTPPDACRLVCVSRSLWENSVRKVRPDPWPLLSQQEAEEMGAVAGRRVRDLGIYRIAVRPVRDEAVRSLAATMKNVEIASMLGITGERVAQIKTGSG